eukprot:scaffold86911_cov80-Attheya_sp.AAC.3
MSTEYWRIRAVECNVLEESLMERSGKLDVLSKILPLWHKLGHRMLIFCQGFTMLKGWKCDRLDMAVHTLLLASTKAWSSEKFTTT